MTATGPGPLDLEAEVAVAERAPAPATPAPREVPGPLHGSEDARPVIPKEHDHPAHLPLVTDVDGNCVTCDLTAERDAARAALEGAQRQLAQTRGRTATSTRTHTLYWSEESLAPLWRELTALRADFLARKPYVGEDAAAAMEERLEACRLAVRRLMDRAD